MGGGGKGRSWDGVCCGNEYGLGDESLNDAHVRDSDTKELLVEASHLEGGSVATQAGLHEDGHKFFVEVERGMVTEARGGAG